MCSSQDAMDDDDVCGGREERCGDCADHTLHRDSRTKLEIGTDCKKCGDKASVVLRQRDIYCMKCLQASVTHKFRSSLGKSHLMKTGENVLVAFSGGPSSSAMLRLIKEGLEETSHKRLRFNPIVVYVDESTLLKVESVTRDATFQEIATTVRQHGFPFVVTSLDKVMTDDPNFFTEVLAGANICRFPIENNDETNRLLLRFLDSAKGLTSKEDLIAILRQRLLYHIARCFHCSKIFLGETETRISVRLLADIAQGKGRHISLTCGFVDNRFDDILILRPLREILSKEITFYLQSKAVPTVTLPTITTKHDGSDSILHMTETFVLNLQKDFPSTVSTIFRTGNKIGSAAGKSQQGPISVSKRSPSNCILCYAPLVYQNKDVEPAADSQQDQSHTYGNRLFQKPGMDRLSCYSCKHILCDISDVDILPHYAITALETQLEMAEPGS